VKQKDGRLSLSLHLEEQLEIVQLAEQKSATRISHPMEAKVLYSQTCSIFWRTLDCIESREPKKANLHDLQRSNTPNHGQNPKTTPAIAK
jgi:hypothetical protein